MLRYLPLVAVVAFTVYCAFDVLGSDAHRRRGLPAVAWLLIVLVPVLGGVAWLVAGRGASPAGGPGPRRSGPVAPDDDPEFLFRLEQEQRRREKTAGPAPTGQQSGEQDVREQGGPPQDDRPQDGRTDDRGATGSADGAPST
ncbi:PLD nuclease N-terminal domain-containing protein [Cellulomonas sp. S1-8]|uniref:PLD nuclease N-terminal domain-containing protein n=1 Tax=Cellulomonas sp. S1-8 TaxID=2904790 RepID=UPI0022434A82|nr:PLDc N-terminal domain-containing protein [Cellulomonas sp. S1-8]UZN02389.1 PLDc N-terminal domain-containing protein [Cellulomonas sp. S1-8]